MPWFREFERANETPFVTVTPGRHPFEVAAFAVLFIAGLIGVFGHPAPNVKAEFPPLVVFFIYAMTALWSGVGLLGLAQRDQMFRLSLERIGCRGMAAVVVAFIATAGVVSGPEALRASLSSAWIAVGAIWRAYQIGRDLKRLQEVRAQQARKPTGGKE